MDTYVVNLDSQKPTLKHKVYAALGLGCTYFVFFFAWKFLWPTSADRNTGLFGIAAEAALISVFFSVGMVFFRRPGLSSSYKLLVDEQSMTSVVQFTGWMKWWVIRRTVSKGKVGRIWEVKGTGGIPRGIGVSEKHSRFAGWMGGFVYLPNTLPDYESLRHLAESWRSPQAST